jgi:hypothetical protein
MGAGDLNDLATLREARKRAQKVLDDLKNQKDDLFRSPPAKLNEKRLRAGEKAMRNAIESAKRMVADIDDSIRAATLQSEGNK